VNLESAPKQFAVLQIRPCGVAGEREQVDLGTLRG